MHTKNKLMENLYDFGIKRKNLTNRFSFYQKIIWKFWKTHVFSTIYFGIAIMTNNDIKSICLSKFERICVIRYPNPVYN